MLILLAMWAFVWGLGMATKAPLRQRYIMMAVVFAGWVGLQLILPVGHPARVTADYLTRSVVGVAFLAGLVWLYRKWFAKIQARAVQATPDVSLARPASYSDSELGRYARHITLREIGGAGQKRLRDARVLVIGAGGLGSPALQYLAAAGVGRLGVIDDDEVEPSNLQRQVIHPDAMIGAPKVRSAAATLRAQNPFVEVRPYHRRFTEEIAAELIADYDLVLDGCDDMDTRYLVNQVCVAAGVPLVSAALTQWEGQLSVFDPSRGAPCYACVFPSAPAAGLGATCAEAGVAAPLPGVLGTMMAVEAIKVLTDAGEPLRGRMLIYDALHADMRVISTKRRQDCAVCGGVSAAGA